MRRSYVHKNGACKEQYMKRISEILNLVTRTGQQYSIPRQTEMHEVES